MAFCKATGVTLARAITVIESEHPADAELAQRILDGALPHAGNSRRAGITGPPGFREITFIDALGIHLIRDHGEKVAVLSVDPSSQISGGSILGDKTRMERLSAEDRRLHSTKPGAGSSRRRCPADSGDDSAMRGRRLQQRAC